MIVLALTAALVGPYFIDWTPYRAAFEREAGRILDRRVTVEGHAYARLLPFPSVTFTNVTVAGEQPNQLAMTVEQFSMDAELAPFLRGEVLIFDMRLDRPRVHIEVSQDGGIDWAVRPSTPFDPRQVTLERVTITDGSIELIHEASGRTHRLAEIDAELSARTLAGPWRIDGTAALDGVRTALNVSTGTVGEDGEMRLRMEARPERYPVSLSTDGQASLEKGAARYAGSFRLHTLDATPNDNEPARNATGANRVSGRFSLAHDRLAVEEFRLESGPVEDPYTADGEAYVDLGAEPRFSILADGAQIRLNGPGEDAAQGQGIPLAERFASFRRFMLNLPRPAIPGTVAVNLPAIVAGDTTIRNIRLSARPADGGWAIDTIAARLPGRTTFEGEGLLSTSEALGFSGEMLLAVGQPSGFAAWLARDVDDAIRRLPSAGFSAKVELTENSQSFSDLELILGDARFTGSAQRRRPADARPSLQLALDGGRLDLDGLAAFAALFVSEEGENRLVDHDIDFEITAGPVAAAGLTAETVDTSLRLREGELEIDRLTVGGLVGAQVSATGQIRNLAEEPTGKIDAAIVSVDLAPLITRLAERFPDNRVFDALARRAEAYPGLFSDAEIDFVGSAADNGDGSSGLAVSAEGLAGGTEFSFAGSGLYRAGEGAPFTINFNAANEEAAALYALYGLPALPFGLAGAAETEFSATGTMTGGAEISVRFAGEGLEAHFSGVAVLGGEVPALRGEVRLDSDDMEPWLAMAGVVLPDFGLGLPVRLDASVDYDGALAVISGISGEIAGSAVGGDLNGSIREGKPHLEGALDLDAIDLAPAAELVLGDTAFDIEPEGRQQDWPRVPFANQMNAPVSADIALTADRLYAGNAVTARDASLRLRLDADGLAVSDLSAALHDGRISGLVELGNNGGTGLFSAQLRLSDAQIASIAPGTGLSGRADLSMEATASGKSVDGMIAALSGSGSASLRDLTISGVNPDALAPILDRADAIGRDIDAAATSGFAPEILRDGAFAVGETELAFTIAGGVARTPPVQMTGDGMTLTAEARVDFPAWRLSAEGSIAYEAGVEAVTGSEPVVRFSAAGTPGAADATFDIDPLAQYLTQRALEREQARVEHMQAVLLEKQRLRRETRYYAALEEERARAEAERRRFARETERLRREAEERARRQAEEEARRRAEDEARRRAEQEARRAEEESRRAEEEAPEAQPPPPQREAEETPTAEGDIERRPLSPPAGREGAARGSRETRDPVTDYFRSENLTVEGLLKLIEPQQ